MDIIEILLLYPVALRTGFHMTYILFPGRSDSNPLLWFEVIFGYFRISIIADFIAKLCDY